MNPDSIKNKINEFASQGKPFLFAINFEQTDGFFIENPLTQKDILFKTPLGTNIDNNRHTVQHNFFNIYPESFETYLAKFRIVENALKRGDSFLTNLTIKTPIKVDVSLEDIFHLSNAPYTLYMPNSFVCFSPERFVHIAGQEISTNPMKGTIDANIPDAENIILADTKETAEHNTIVDLLRNDLSIVAKQVTVNKFRYIDHIRTQNSDILQVSSKICGILKDNYTLRLGSAIFEMLPAGSVSGAPKDSTLRIIKGVEREPRDFYCGIFGYFDGQELDSAVMIRYIEEDENGQKYFRSGGGITASSNAENEYKEAIQKIYLPML